MPDRTTALQKIKNPYDELLSEVRATLTAGQRQIESMRIKIYWKTGEQIHKHILKYAKRAEYGAEVIGQLAIDLNLDRTILNRCVKFVEKYPKLPISAGRHQFKWSHFRELIGITDDKERKRLEEAIQRNDWTSNELIARIKAQRTEVISKTTAEPDPKPAKHDLLVPLRGELYTYKIIKRRRVEKPDEEVLSLDLGFGGSLDLNPRIQGQFKEGDYVVSAQKGDKYTYRKKEGTTDKDRFTYRASIEKIIDGDTLKVNFDIGFKTHLSHTLRLRGIDCPEMSTKEGAAAKIFVQSYIKEAQTILVRSFHDDKYGRYLADVFILPPASGKEYIYLNNLLLQNAHAVRM